jgi:hypothetical protein
MPNDVMNELASWSDSFIFIWWYLERHQGNIVAHTLRLSQQFDRFVAKEKELWDMLYSN